ncbi:MAG TPA: site-specific integrase, partial [Acidimicrobiales bacterium]|nr:site-specific integrase [Acidimicrobiales bacterium]
MGDAAAGHGTVAAESRSRGERRRAVAVAATHLDSETVRRPLSRDAEEFLSFLAVEKGRAPASIAAYRRDLRAYEEFLFGRGLSLAEAGPRVVEDYLAFLAASGRRATSNARAY